MLPLELKLASLNHCYVQLPNNFVKQGTDLKTNSILAVRSIQNDVEIHVTWNGQITSGNFAQLDINFAQANKLQEELIILCHLRDLEISECSLCRVELLEASDYSILSQHVDANVLDTCLLVSQDLVIPIWLSQHVKVLVKVMCLEPEKGFAFLTRWTEMQYQHSLSKDLKKIELEEQNKEVVNSIPFISCSLGIGYEPKFFLGSMLVCGERGSGKTYFLRSIMKNYKGYKSEIFNCRQLRGKRIETIKKLLFDVLDNALENQPFILALDDIDFIATNDAKNENDKGQDAIYKKRLVDVLCFLLKKLERSEHEKGHLVAVIATCRQLEGLDQRLSKPKGKKYFVEVVTLGALNQDKRVEIIKSIISEYKQIQVDVTDEQLNNIANKCKSFTPLDLRRLVERSFISSCSRSLVEFTSDPSRLLELDLLNSLEGYIPTSLRGIAMQAKSSRTFSDVGGMSIVKDAIKKTIIMRIKYPSLFIKCPLRTQTSILLYGPPGCGKTMVAEALTNEEYLNSICVRGPELLSKYIGASESAVRDLFHRAELARPCVIFFDEFESLVSKRGADSTGVTDRIVNQFLTLMDGVERLSSDIFIIAATSRPDMIDPAMLRPGRLDKHLYCGPPDQSDRLEILKILSKNIDIGEEENDLNLVEWSKKLVCFTGADIQALLYSAQVQALHEILCSGQSDEEQRDKSKLEIKIRQAHMEVAYEGMKKEVEMRYASFAYRYPNSIREARNKVVATRATLA